MKVRPVPVVLFALIACVAVSTPALAVTTVSRSGTTVTITGGDEANFLGTFQGTLTIKKKLRATAMHSPSPAMDPRIRARISVARDPISSAATA